MELIVRFNKVTLEWGFKSYLLPQIRHDKTIHIFININVKNTGCFIADDLQPAHCNGALYIKGCFSKKLEKTTQLVVATGR